MVEFNGTLVLHMYIHIRRYFTNELCCFAPHHPYMHNIVLKVLILIYFTTFDQTLALVFFKNPLLIELSTCQNPFIFYGMVGVADWELAKNVKKKFIYSLECETIVPTI